MLLIEMLAPGTNIKAQKYCLPRVTFTLPHKKRDAARRHPADAAKDWYVWRPDRSAAKTPPATPTRICGSLLPGSYLNVPKLVFVELIDQKK